MITFYWSDQQEGMSTLWVEFRLEDGTSRNVAVGALIELDDGYEYVHFDHEISLPIKYTFTSMATAKRSAEVAVSLAADMGELAAKFPTRTRIHRS